MSKSFSLFKKRLNLPQLKEVVYILRSLEFKEKMAFFALTAIFVISALGILWEVNNNFSENVPMRGGTLKEGIMGTPRFVNPLLAISDADRDVTSLVYSGLMRPDNKGGLMPDLAEKYEISEDGLVYTFTLRPNLVWQDGEPLTSDDILFTIQQAKDPNLKSPRRASWEGVEINKINDRTVEFVLRKPYSPFLENTTIGILPKHIWNKALSELMPLSDFNVEPIGSGPYKIEKVKKDSSGIVYSYILESNEKFALGEPNIEKLVLKFYKSEEDLLSAYEKHNIDSISAVSPQSAVEIKRDNGVAKTVSLPRVFGVFFNQNNAKIFAQKEVREALNIATDKGRIVSEVLKGFGAELDYPLPPGAFGAIEKIAGTEIKSPDSKAVFTGIEKAREILAKNGWRAEETGEIIITDETGATTTQKTYGALEKKIKKETLRLEFSLATSDTQELKQTAELLKEMWEAIGVKVTLKVFEMGDLNQNVIRPRKYDALLFGEMVGRNPDPFAFWHSSQRNDPGLNIAMYMNVKVDKLLEEIRTTSDNEERKNMYVKFQEEVAKDVPAVFIYSPNFIYLVPKYLNGAEDIKSITVPSERFSQIYKWHIKTGKVWKIFAK